MLPLIGSLNDFWANFNSSLGCSPSQDANHHHFRQHRASQDVDGASLLAVVSHAEACVCVDLVFFWNDMQRHHETGHYFSNHRGNQ